MPYKPDQLTDYFIIIQVFDMHTGILGRVPGFQADFL